MVLTETPTADLGAPAADFKLPGIDGREYCIDDCRDDAGLLVMFICNHCPYVQAIQAKIVRDSARLAAEGIGCVAIMPNDTEAYPQDGLEPMKRVAKEWAYPFPYLLDETQATAKAYGAVCTPDFFGYNAELILQYRGRLDASGPARTMPDAEPELYNAMHQIARTGSGPAQQYPSLGCSIKWRPDHA